MKNIRLILGIALALRVVVWWGGLGDPHRFLTPDSHDYLRLAATLNVDGRYGTPEQPEIFRAPGYPLFLALLQHVSTSYTWLAWVQLLIDSVTCYLLWQLSRLLFKDDRAAGWVLIFQSCNVVSIVYAVTLLSETIYAFFLTLLLYQLIKYDQKPQSNFLHGFLLGVNAIVLTYIRAITLPFLVLPLISLLIAKRRREALVFGFVLAIGLIPWVVRNERLILICIGTTRVCCWRITNTACLTIS
jgi:Gpi18-like mannosyltransferase